MVAKTSRTADVDVDVESSRLRKTAYHASVTPTRDELFSMFKETACKHSEPSAFEVSREDFDALCTIVKNQTKVNMYNQRKARRTWQIAVAMSVVMLLSVVVSTASSTLAFVQVTETKVSSSNQLTNKNGDALVTTALSEQGVPLKWAAFLPLHALEQVKALTLKVPLDWKVATGDDHYFARYTIVGFELQLPRLANATSGTSYRPAVLTLFTARGDDLIVVYNDKIELLRLSTGSRVGVCGKATCASLTVTGVDVDRLEEHVEAFLKHLPSSERCDLDKRRLGDTQPYVVLCNPELAGVQGSVGGEPMSTSCTQDAALAGCTTCHLNAPSCKGNWESPANGCRCCK